jgi:hypothetical protein
MEKNFFQFSLRAHAGVKAASSSHLKCCKKMDSIKQFPVEIWSRLSDFLEGQWVVCLWLTGDKLLLYKLSLAISQFHLEYSPYYKYFYWPNLIKHFSNLRILCLSTTIDLVGEPVFSLDKVNLYDLPPSLTELSLHFDNVLDIFCDSDVAAKNGSRIFELGSFLPNLQSLTLHGKAVDDLKCFLDYLPNHLTRLNLKGQTLNVGRISSLPRHLKTLCVTTFEYWIDDDDEAIILWPPYLKEIHVDNFRRCSLSMYHTLRNQTTPEPSLVQKIFGTLPETLTLIDFSKVNLSSVPYREHIYGATWAIVPLFVRNYGLKTLNIPTLAIDEIDQLPPHLTNLRLPFTAMKISDANINVRLKKLSCLKTLEVGFELCAPLTSDQPLMDLELTHSLQHLIFTLDHLQILTPGSISPLVHLTKLWVYLENGTSLFNANYNKIILPELSHSLRDLRWPILLDDQLQLLPPQLIYLMIDQFLPLKKQTFDWTNHFSQLKKLVLYSAILCDASPYVKYLPSTLQELAMHSFQFVNSDASYLPPSLQDLRIIHTNTIGNTCLTGDFLQCLPRSLRHLRLEHPSKYSFKDLSFLPRRLLALYLRSTGCCFVNDSLSYLPPHLTSLMLPSEISLTTECTANLPRNLLFLHLNQMPTQILKEKTTQVCKQLKFVY